MEDNNLEIDSYLGVKSDNYSGSNYNFVEKVYLSSYNEVSVHPALTDHNEGFSIRDILKERLQRQIDNGGNKTIYARTHPADAQLDTLALRQELVERYRLSGDTAYIIKKVGVGHLKGEEQLCSPSGKALRPSTYLLNLL